MCPNFRDPVETEQLRGLIPGKRIREFKCALPPSYRDDGRLATVISNMDALEKSAVLNLWTAKRDLAPLTQHANTLVELDFWGCCLDGQFLIGFLEQCLRLQVFVASRVRAVVAVKSQSWVCTGLRTLRVPRRPRWSPKSV